VAFVCAFAVSLAIDGALGVAGMVLGAAGTD
jgi:hypothetical protein